MMLNSLFANNAFKYQKIWSPKFGQKLSIKRDKINLFDLYAMGVYSEIKGKIESFTLVGHLPREISHLCKYFFQYNGKLVAAARSTKFRRSPLPQGGLEIPIKLRVGKGKVNFEIFRKVKSFVLDNYLKSEKIMLDVKTEGEEEDEFFVTFQIFKLFSLENNYIRVFKCNTIFYLNTLISVNLISSNQSYLHLITELLFFVQF